MAKPTLTGLTFEQARQQSRNMRNTLVFNVTRQQRAEIVGVSVSAIAHWDKEDRLLAKIEGKDRVIENKDKKVKLLEGEIRGLRESCKVDKNEQPSNENKNK